MGKKCKHNWKFAESRIKIRKGRVYDYKIYVFYCTKCAETKEKAELTNELKKKKHWWQ